MRNIHVSELKSGKELYYHNPLVLQSKPEPASYLEHGGDFYRFQVGGEEIKLYDVEVALFIWVDEPPLPPNRGSRRLWSYG